MKLIYVFLSIMLLHITVLSSELSAQQSTYKASMDGWKVDLNKAFQEAQKRGVPILANFTGTDWCGWCIRLKNSVFNTQEFKKWAKDNVVLLEVDFPRRFRLPDNIAKQNAGLQQAFQVRGYPTVWVFDMNIDKKTGKTNILALAKTGYVASATDFIKNIETNIQASRKKNTSNCCQLAVGGKTAVLALFAGLQRRDHSNPSVQASDFACKSVGCCHRNSGAKEPNDRFPILR